MTPFNDLDELSIFDMFRMEVEEQIEPMQTALLTVGSPDGVVNETSLKTLMRAAHSLKGAARIVGLTAAVQLTHAMEERFVAAQEGRGIVPAEVAVLLRGADTLRSLIGVAEEDVSQWTAEHEVSIARLVEELSSAAEQQADPEQQAPPKSNASQDSEPGSQEFEQASDSAAETTPDVARSVDANLRITSLRFDRIIAEASEAMVHTQSLLGLAESLQRKDDRLQHALRAAAKHVDRQRELAHVLQPVEAARVSLSQMLVELDRVVHRMESNSESLHREVLRARLRPFSDVAPSLRRLVHDTANELGKQVVFELSGERAEVDRDILERLRAPLEHLLRNALDHGIETPVERAAAGKPEQASLRMRARHESGRLVVTLIDDGRGVDIEAVRRRAVERGLVQTAAAAELSIAEVLEFLFLPGFSTRTEVTEVSGRGFGLDIVQSTVHESGGAVTIESVEGKGTTFEIVLPVTRSLLRVMQVELAQAVYALPLARLSRVASLDVRREGHEVTVEGAAGEQVPVMALSSVLHDEWEAMPTGLATVLFFLNERGQEAAIGFAVDNVQGEATVAVRELDPRLGKLPCIAAVTLGESHMPMLIIAPDDVLRLAAQMRLRAAATPGVQSGDDVRGSVLVVDDSQTVRQMLRRTLLGARYRVAVAENGAAAWNQLQVESFDLLVSDVDMPEMNGIELVERVRAKARLSHLPVILLSYKGRDEDRQRGLEAGADAYVTKGEFKEAAFLQTVEDLIGPAEFPISLETEPA